MSATVRCRLLPTMLVAGLLIALRAPAEEIRSGAVSVAVVGAAGRLAGFDVSVGGRLVAPVRLSSNGLLTAARVVAARRGDTQTLRFEQLQPRAGVGLTLGATDFVAVELDANDPSPRVRFQLTIRSFNAVVWRAKAGSFPLHFLTCSLPAAEVWHQRGWLMATPGADPFPLLQDEHVGTPEVASLWSRNWSYSCPLGAHPIDRKQKTGPSPTHWLVTSGECHFLAGNAVLSYESRGGPSCRGREETARRRLTTLRGGSRTPAPLGFGEVALPYAVLPRVGGPDRIPR